MEMQDHYLVGHRLVVSTGAPVPFGWKENGRIRETVMKPGQFSLQTHGDMNAPRWSSVFEFVAIALDPTFTAEIAGAALAPEKIEFEAKRSRSDPVIAQFAERFPLRARGR
jgi:AraC family transcriptional regulator